MDLQAAQRAINVIYGHSSSTSPQLLQEAEHELLTIQKSPAGWELGQKLLDQSDPQQQFIGALTFSIKLNDRECEIPYQLRDTLLGLLRQAISCNYARFVVLKLFTTVILLYVRTFQDWQAFVIDLHSILQSNVSLELTFFEELMTTYTRDYTGAPQLRQALSEMVPHIVEMIRLGVQVAPVEALGEFSTWCAVFGSELEVLLPVIFGLLSRNQENDDQEVFTKCCDVLTEVYSANSRGWQKHQRSALIDIVLSCTQPFDWDKTVPLGRLVLAICSNDIRTPGLGADRLIPYIMALTNNPSIDDDELLFEVLEFWTELVEHVVENGMSSQFNAIFMEVIQVYWRRIQIPAGKIDKDSWDKLVSFRRDFCDFLELVYQLLGRETFALFASNILNNLAQGEPAKFNWAEIEASLCCLSGLSDIIDTRGNEYGYIEEVFSSRLWSDLDACPLIRVRNTAVNIIGNYHEFFESEKGRSNLPTTLTFLFTSLNTPTLQLAASRSIQKLCSSCRGVLVGEVFNFLQVYEPLRFKLDPDAHQRTVTAIGNVIEALPLADQPEPLWRLIMMAETSETEPRDMVACVAAIGKAIQKEKDEYSQQQIAEASEFWSNDPKGIQKNLLQLINEAFNMTPDIFEELCFIFKAGMSEKVPNPFTFSPDVTLEFLKGRKAQGRQDDLPPILDLASFLISTQAAAKSLTPDLVLRASQLVTTQARSHSLELLKTALEKAPEVFLQLPDLKDLLQFALEGISSSDRFILNKAAKFWAALVSEPVLAPVVQSVGADLMSKLAIQISGEAERSEVVFFSDVLRKLISHHMKFAFLLLQNAFIDQPIGQNLQKQDIKTRSAFVSQLQLLRGKPQTADIVNKFWMFCRGLPEY